MQRVQTRRQFLVRSAWACSALALCPARSFGFLAKTPRPPQVPDFEAAGLTFLDRAEWTQTPPDVAKLTPALLPERITVHHAGNGVDVTTSEQSVIYELEGILAAHLKRRYGDIGYHFVIDYAGRVWEGRSLAYEGAHVAYANEANLGVVLLGNFDEQHPSAAQLRTLDALVDLLCERYQIRRDRLYGHRDLGYSLCPGRNLYAHVQELRA
jgi:hypothetical protein